MITLLFARHGNTFEVGQTPTFVGARTDLELTEKGRAQSQAMADYIAALDEPVVSLLSSPLKRAWFMAELIGTPRADDRLREIDYGLWENKTEDEVRALCGRVVLADWMKYGKWPKDMNWQPDLKTMRAQVKALLEEKKTGPEGLHVLVTSNGILRFIYEAVTNQKPDSLAKVATGHFCKLVLKQGDWAIETWNVKP